MYNNEAIEKSSAASPQQPGGIMLFINQAQNFKSAFNGPAAHMHIAQLTEDMAQAFYRREHDTIEMLAARGAKFTPEMLHASVGFRDHHLTDKCLHAGVKPDEEMVKIAVTHKDAPLTAALIQRMTPSLELKNYIEDYATEAVKKAAAPALALAKRTL